MKKQYIGEKEIVVVEKIKSKNNDVNSDYVKIIYKEGTEIMPRIMFEAIVTNDSTDATDLRNRRMLKVIKEILTTLLKWDIKLSEVNFINSLINASINDNMETASTKLWKKEPEERTDRKSTRLNSSHIPLSRMPSSA